MADERGGVMSDAQCPQCYGAGHLEADERFPCSACRPHAQPSLPIPPALPVESITLEGVLDAIATSANAVRRWVHVQDWQSALVVYEPAIRHYQRLVGSYRSIELAMLCMEAAPALSAVGRHDDAVAAARTAWGIAAEWQDKARVLQAHRALLEAQSAARDALCEMKGAAQ